MNRAAPTETGGRTICPCGKPLGRAFRFQSVYRCRNGHVWARAYHEDQDEWSLTWRRLGVVVKTELEEAS